MVVVRLGMFVVLVMYVVSVGSDALMAEMGWVE